MAALRSTDVLRRIWYHPANSGKRLRQVARAVTFQIRGRITGRPTLTRIGERSVMWARVHNPGSSKPLYFNPPDFYEMLVWRACLTPGDLFIDVGANAGYYSLWAAEAGAHVIAVEPDMQTRATLEDNIALNGYAVEVLGCALGSTPGQGRLTLGRGPMNRLATIEEPGMEVEMRTLDDVIDGRQAFAKLDVEGAEYMVLAGATESLREHRIRLMQIEWDTSQPDLTGQSVLRIADLLNENGYTLFRAGPAGLEPAGDLTIGGDLFAGLNRSG